MRIALIALAIASGLAVAPPGWADIGVVGAANDLTTGQPPGSDARQLIVTLPVVQNERIVANDNGLAQLVFIDRTTLTVSPNSDVVLDRYIFDPEAGSGEMAVTLARGALRFIGGAITKTNAATVTAPGAVVALRGAVATVDTDDARTRVVLWAGDSARIETPGGSLTLSRPGAVAIVDLRDPGPPRYDGVIENVEAGALLGVFRSEGNGGARLGGLRETTGETAALGGADRGPVSTRGEVALLDEPGLGFFERVSTRLDQQSTVFSLPERVRPGNMDFVDIGGEGVVRGQLSWRNAADLDLHLILPNEAGEVSFRRRSITFNNGGAVAELDVDNLGGTITVQPDLRVENIRVNGRNVPAGRYVFFVNVFNQNGVEAMDFRLRATGDDGRNVSQIEGVLTDRGERRELPVRKD